MIKGKKKDKEGNDMTEETMCAKDLCIDGEKQKPQKKGEDTKRHTLKREWPRLDTHTDRGERGTTRRLEARGRKRKQKPQDG